MSTLKIMVKRAQSRQKAVPDSNILNRDFVIDPSSKIPNDHGVILFQTLPQVKSLSTKNQKATDERNAVWIYKMMQCSYRFEFPVGADILDEKKRKDPARAARKSKSACLQEIVKAVNKANFQPTFPQNVVQAIVDMVAANIFTPLPPVEIAPSYSIASRPLWKEQVPAESAHQPHNDWSHREKVYAFYLRMLQKTGEFTECARTRQFFKDAMSKRFLTCLISLTASHDKREREQVQLLVTHIHTNFTGLRQQIQNAISEAICRFATDPSEQTEHNSETTVPELLTLACQIIEQNGFGFGYNSTSERSRTFLRRVILTLYQVPVEFLNSYTTSLFNTVNRCIYRQPSLVPLAIRYLLKVWPLQGTYKEGLFLNQILGIFLAVDAAFVNQAKSAPDAPELPRSPSNRFSVERDNSAEGRSSQSGGGGYAASPTHTSTASFSFTANGERKSTTTENSASAKSITSPGAGTARTHLRRLPSTVFPTDFLSDPFEQFLPIQELLFKRIKRCVNSPHACVSKAAVELVNNPVVLKFIKSEASRSIIFPIIYPALCGKKNHPFVSLRKIIVMLVLTLERTDAELCEKSMESFKTAGGTAPVEEQPQSPVGNAAPGSDNSPQDTVDKEARKRTWEMLETIVGEDEEDPPKSPLPSNPPPKENGLLSSPLMHKGSLKPRSMSMNIPQALPSSPTATDKKNPRAFRGLSAIRRISKLEIEPDLMALFKKVHEEREAKPDAEVEDEDDGADDGDDAEPEADEEERGSLHRKGTLSPSAKTRIVETDASFHKNAVVGRTAAQSTSSSSTAPSGQSPPDNDELVRSISISSAARCSLDPPSDS